MKYKDKKDARKYYQVLLAKNKLSQAEQIWINLYEMKPRTTPCYYFAMELGIMSYSKRISELRERGWNVENIKDGNRSSYRLILE